MQRNIKALLISALIITAIAGYEAFHLIFVLKQNQSFKKQIADVSKEKIILEARLKEVSDIVNSLKAGAADFQKIIDAKENEKLALSGQIAKAQTDAQSLRSELANYKKDLEEKQKQEKKFKDQTTKAQAEAQSSKEELKKVKAKIKELNSELNNINAQKASLERLNSKIGSTLQKTRDRLSRNLEDLRSLKQKLSRINNEDISPLKAEISRLNESLTEKDKEFAAKDAQLRDITQKFNTQNNSNQFLEKKISRLETEKSSLQGKIAKADEQLYQQKSSTLSLKNDINSVTELFAKSSVDSDRKEKELVALKDEISNLKGRQSDLELQLSTAKERYKRVIEDFGDLTKLNTTLQDRLGKLSTFLEPEDQDQKKAGELKRKIEVILKSSDSGQETKDSTDAPK